MPITVAAGARPGFLFTNATGSLTLAELLAFVQDVWATANLPILFDSSNACVTRLTAADVQALADATSQLNHATSASAHLAIVAPSDGNFGMARMYQSMAEASGGRASIGVFRSTGEAIAWIRNLGLVL